MKVQELLLHTKKKIVDNQIEKLKAKERQEIENERIAQSQRDAYNKQRLNEANEAKELEYTKRRDAIDKQIMYLEENLAQINQEIQQLSNPVVVDFSTETERNSKNHHEATIAAEEYRVEIYDKQHYTITKMKLFSLKVTIAIIVASIIGKLSASNPELIENLVMFTFFADMDNLGDTFGLFLDFTSQEFLLVFVSSEALSLLIRNESYIHNQVVKYVSIWVIVISMVAIIILSTF